MLSLADRSHETLARANSPAAKSCERGPEAFYALRGKQKAGKRFAYLVIINLHWQCECWLSHNLLWGHNVSATKSVH